MSATPHSPERSGSGGRAALWLFAGLTLLFAGTTSGRVHEPDGVVMARTAGAIVERGSLALDDPGYPPDFLTRGVDGRRYGKYGVGFPFWAAPFHAAGAALAERAPAGSEAVFAGPRFLWYDAGDRAQAFRFFGVSLANAPLVAAACALLLPIALEVGLGARVGVAAALLAAIGSPLLVYAKSSFAEPLTALGLTAAAWCVARWRRGFAGAALGAGAGLAVAVLAKPATVVVLPVVALAAVIAARDPRGVPGGTTAARRLRGGALRAAVPLAAAAAAMLALNDRLFGSPFATGYGDDLGRWTTPWATGLAGLLASPGRGLLVYFPAVVLALAGAVVVWRLAPWAVVWAWGCFLALLLLHARWFGWDGGWCWGPRFLVPALPLLALLAAAALGATPPRSPVRWAGLALVLVSAAVSWTGTLVASTEYHHALRRVVGPAAYLETARWSWDVLPARLYWELPKGYWLLPRALDVPEARWLAVALALGLVAGALALVRAARLAARAASTGEPPVTPAAA